MTGGESAAVWLTLRVALVSTLAVFPPGLIIGWILARKDFRGKALLEGLVSLPLVAPPVVTGYLLLIACGKTGVPGRWLWEQCGLSLTFNFPALVIASSAVALPLAVRTIRSAFAMVDPALENASLTLGVSRLETFFRISLPLAAPGIAAGLVLAFARSLGEFGATVTLAGNIAGKTQTIALMVFSDMQVPGYEARVFRLVCVSLCLSFAALALSDTVIRRMTRGPV